jgi:hypothetical protein
MPRHGFRFTVTVKDDERAFLTRDGCFEQLLGPGKFTSFDLDLRLDAEVVKVVRAEIAPERAFQFQRTHPSFADEHFEIVQAGPAQVGIVSFDGDPKHIVSPNTTRAFWKTLTKVDVEMIDTTEMRISKRHLDMMDLSRISIAVQATVEAHEAGLLIVDGKLTECLTPGRYAYWTVGRTVRVTKVDLRPQPLEVTAQEILTKDRVALRVTLTAFYKVTDPELAATATGDLANTSPSGVKH